MAASFGDRAVLWLLSVLASFGIAGSLAIWRWSVEYDTLAPLCRTASSECLSAVEHDATLVAFASFAVLFVFALVISTTFVFRVQFFGAGTQASDQLRQHSLEEDSSEDRAGRIGENSTQFGKAA